MRITGYRTLTEKERDYLTIHRLLRKHELPIPEIAEFLDALIEKGWGIESIVVQQRSHIALAPSR